MIRRVLRQKHQILDGNNLTSSGCKTGPLGLGLALPHTYIILPFFCLHCTSTEQELAAFGWGGLMAVTSPSVPSHKQNPAPWMHQPLSAQEAGEKYLCMANHCWGCSPVVCCPRSSSVPRWMSNSVGWAHPKQQMIRTDFFPCHCPFPLSSCRCSACCAKLAEITSEQFLAFLLQGYC